MLSRPVRLVILAVFATFPMQPARAADVSGIAAVIDGDSLTVGKIHVRLAGVDAPELSQICKVGHKNWMAGEEAAAWMKSRAEGRQIYCTSTGTDRYKRQIATCYVDGEDINAALVAAGWAVAYRQYSDRYIPEETAARARGIGIWRGMCDPPSSWRTEHRGK